MRNRKKHFTGSIPLTPSEKEDLRKSTKEGFAILRELHKKERKKKVRRSKGPAKMKKAIKKKFPGHEILFNKAKAEFDKAFSRYALFLLKHYSVLVETPGFYYSVKLAKRGGPQGQTKYYLDKLTEIKKIHWKDNRNNQQYKLR